MILQSFMDALVTAVDRKTLYTWIGFVSTSDATSVGTSLIQLLGPYEATIKTLTSDNGKEFAQHERVAEQLDCDFYFAHPYCSWERDINENTNGLIRQYIRKGTSMAHVTDSLLEFIMERLNNRPRKKLGFATPKEAFFVGRVPFGAGLALRLPFGQWLRHGLRLLSHSSRDKSLFVGNLQQPLLH